MATDRFRHDLSLLDPAAKAAIERRPAIYVGGAWHTVAHTLPAIDPSSGAQVGAIARGGEAEVDAAVTAARAAFVGGWAATGALSREGLLRRLADLIDENVAMIAQVETVDNGMPLWLSTRNVRGAAGVLRYYAGWPSKIAGDTMPLEAPPGAGELLGLIQRVPLGVIAAIVPWNVPFMMAIWKLAPALAAGCTIVLKPAEDTSLSALVLADLVEQAGFPPGVVNIVTGLGEEAGSALCSHAGITAVSFTGSTNTGRRVGEAAGRGLKRLTLELGGKSPSLLFADADLDRAVEGVAASIFTNSGQICVAGSRLYIQSAVYDEVMERLGGHLATLSIGAGLNPDIFMGPLASAAHRHRVRRYLDQARADGLFVLDGSPVPDAPGCYLSPAIVAGAGPDHPITREEIFGPVLAVYRFDEEDEALSHANASAYALAATIWSRNVSRVLRIAGALDCGRVTVNTHGTPLPMMPEGGNKASGHGRNLGKEALDACLTTKSIMIRL